MKLKLSTKPVGLVFFTEYENLENTPYSIINVTAHSTRKNWYNVTLDLNASNGFAQWVKKYSPVEPVQFKKCHSVWRLDDYVAKLYWDKASRDREVSLCKKLGTLSKKIYETFDNPHNSEYGIISEYIEGVPLTEDNISPEIDKSLELIFLQIKELIQEDFDFNTENFILTPSGDIRCIDC